MPGFATVGSRPNRLVVVGAGVSGLAFAREALRRRPELDVLVLESSERVGGLVRTEEPLAGIRVELGPDSFSRLGGVTDAMLESLSLREDVVAGGDAPRKAFLGRDGQLIPLPASLLGAAASSRELAATPVLRATTKLRMALEPLVRTRTATTPESAAEFIRRRFGDGFLDDALGALLHAIYGAPATELGADQVLARFASMEREFGSVTRGLRSAKPSNDPPVTGVISLRQGMEQLPRALAMALGDRVRCETTVSRVVRRARGFRIELADESSLDADAVVVTAPTKAAARLVESLAPDASSELASIGSKPVETISLLFEQRDAPPPLEGTGFILSERSARVLTALSWSNRKWHDRAPARYELLRCVVRGGARDDREVVADLERDLREWLGTFGPPVGTFVDRRRVSLPVHGVGHASRVARMRDALATQPGLFVLGNGIEGLGVSDCMRTAERLAADVTQNAPSSVSPCGSESARRATS